MTTTDLDPALRAAGQSFTMSLTVLLARVLPGNPKKHDRDGVATSILRFGFTVHVAIDPASGFMVAGHGRVEALEYLRAGGRELATELMRRDGAIGPEEEYAGAWPPRRIVLDDQGEWQVPIIQITFANDEERDAYVIADNALTEKGGWDDDALRTMLARLGKGRLGSMGLDAERYNSIMAGFRVRLQEPREPEKAPDLITRLGDVWILGDHRLVCGDSLEHAIETACDGERARACFTDFPYNVDVVSGHREIAKSERKRRSAASGAEFTSIQNDTMTPEAFAKFLHSAIDRIYNQLEPGAPFFGFMSWREWASMDTLLRARGFHWSSVLIYAKDSFTLSNCDFHPQHEGCWYGWRGDAPRLVQVEARNISDLWNFSRPTVGQQGEHHPTEKPIELVIRALRHTTRRGDLVIDPFGGGGSTLLACESTGRRARICELEPRWCDYMVRRWEGASGGKAQRIASLA